MDNYTRALRDLPKDCRNNAEVDDTYRVTFRNWSGAECKKAAMDVGPVAAILSVVYALVIAFYVGAFMTGSSSAKAEDAYVHAAFVPLRMPLHARVSEYCALPGAALCGDRPTRSIFAVYSWLLLLGAPCTVFLWLVWWLVSVQGSAPVQSTEAHHRRAHEHWARQVKSERVCFIAERACEY